MSLFYKNEFKIEDYFKKKLQQAIKKNAFVHTYSSNCQAINYNHYFNQNADCPFHLSENKLYDLKHPVIFFRRLTT